MKLVKKLAKRLKKAAKRGDISECDKLSFEIAKVMRTYDRCC